MDLSQNRIDALLAAPSESLNVEIKRWIDPKSPEGSAKIAKAAMSLRNRNGGYLVIGLDDKTLLPDDKGRPDDPRATFHADIVQGIVSKYSAIAFEVEVGFASRDGAEFPVIGISEGVTVPVCCKADLMSADGITLLKQNALYFRSLNSNGTPSSTNIGWNDWRELVEICFENREADIGRFLRRHLGQGGVSTLAEALSAATAKTPSIEDRAVEAMAIGEARRDKAFADNYEGALDAFNQFGAYSVALVFDPIREGHTDQKFLNIIGSANPQLTGWPVWLDSRGFTDRSAAPKMLDGVWQAFIVNLARGWFSHLDFQTMDAQGSFYLWRLLDDDQTDKVEPLTQLDPLLAIYRVAEILAVGLAFAKALGQPEDSKLGFLFKWTKLNGRKLDAWANRGAYFSPGRTAYDAEVTSFVEVPLNTPVSALAPVLSQAIAPLMRSFDGYEVSTQVVEQQMQRLLERAR